MNKTVLMTATIASLTVNVFAADNNFIGGTNNTVTNNAKSVGVVGYQNTVGGNNAVAFGENNIAAGTNSFAGGNDSKALGRDSFAYGAHAEATIEYTVAIGSQARTAAYNTIAIGNGAYANGESTVVLGRTNTVNAENATVVGSNNGAVASGHGVVVGYNNKVQGSDKEMLAFGSNNTVQNQGATVLGSHGQAVAVDSLALGNNTVADVQNSVALGTNSTTEEVVSTNHIYINGEKYDFAGGVANSTVSIGANNKAGNGGVQNYKRTLTNVAAGRVDGTSTDAVNGSQLNAVINALKFTTVAGGANTTVNRTQNIDGGKEFAVHVNKDLTNMNSVQFGTVNDPQRNYIGRNGSHVFNGEVNSNYSSNGFKVENTDNLDNAQFNMDGMVADSNGKHIEFTTQNITAGHQQVHNVADGVADTDAVNMRQLKAQSQSGLNEINTTNQRLNKLGASSAALAGLHPLDFNKDDKASYAISYGHYRSSNAVALGAFYRPNERTMFGIGMSLGAEKQFTANVAFKVGKGSDYVQEAKDAQSRISKLEALVNQLVEEVERSKQSK
ncbi:MAG: YadA-like family protein [Veillonella sp.]|uniref:YadA-like family protein n=1 Tax=Veillonella sp. TaxID=1926307 RepID=UPI002915B99F|nr:YadA-like family protein [Veillonella sp.]MDU7715418.1 YadA-like family protein [Veillonella sp.]